MSKPVDVDFLKKLLFFTEKRIAGDRTGFMAGQADRIRKEIADATPPPKKKVKRGKK